MVHAGVVFAHNKTLQPLLNAPVSQTAYTASKPLDIFIYEKAQVGSLQLRIQFSHMGRWAAVNDTNGDRVLILASSFEDPGSHSCTLKALDETQPSCITNIINPSQLLHGCIYNVLLSMQDFVGNPVATAMSYEIEHDVRTETPGFSEPSKDRIKVAFALQFTLPENATSGSVKLKIDSWRR